MTRVPLALRVLAVLLAGWEPIVAALVWAGQLSRVLDRGPLVWMFAVGRVLLSGLGIAAGAALWQGRSAGVLFARVFLLLSLAASAIAIWAPFMPGRPQPGTEWAAFGLVAAHHGGWLVYLSSSSRVRLLDA